MTDQYLRGPKTIINERDYDATNEVQTVTVNGISMSIEDFRKLRPSKKRFCGMGIIQNKKSVPQDKENIYD